MRCVKGRDFLIHIRIYMEKWLFHKEIFMRKEFLNVCPFLDPGFLKMASNRREKKWTPMRGIEPRPRRWKRRILTTRPHGTDEWKRTFFHDLSALSLSGKNIGPTEIRTRITGFRVLGANHYTMGPTWKISFYITIIFWMLVSSLEEVSHDQLNVSSAVVAEWLRRLTRNQLRSPCTGSNPVNCDFFFSHLLRARTSDASSASQWKGYDFIELVTGR